MIVGQPRTGTTILYDLLAQDPAPAGPAQRGRSTCRCRRPRPATYDTDPRIDEVQATIDMADSLIPGFTGFHPMGARLGPGVRAHHGERLPQHDLPHAVPRCRPTTAGCSTRPTWRPPTAGTGMYLQHLQSRAPRRPVAPQVAGAPVAPRRAARASTPTPSWCRPTAIRSRWWRRSARSWPTCGAWPATRPRSPRPPPSYADDIFLGLDRAMEARDRRHASRPSRSSTCSSPTSSPTRWPPSARLYDAARARRSPTRPRTACGRFLAEHPGDGGGGGHRYRFADTGLDADDAPRAGRGLPGALRRRVRDAALTPRAQ